MEVIIFRASIRDSESHILVIKMLSMYQDTWMDVNIYAKFDIRNRDKRLLEHIKTCSDQIF